MEMLHITAGDHVDEIPQARQEMGLCLSSGHNEELSSQKAEAVGQHSGPGISTNVTGAQRAPC